MIADKPANHGTSHMFGKQTVVVRFMGSIREGVLGEIIQRGESSIPKDAIFIYPIQKSSVSLSARAATIL